MGSSTVHRRGAVVPVLVAGCLAGAVLAAAHAQSGATPQAATSIPDPALQVTALLRGTLPVAAEHRYRIAGKIRPLLVFWIGKDNIGSARVRWRRGEPGEVGYDLLIGSDPDRAPRKTNRWGFIMEESAAGGATLLGVMKKGEEETLEEAKASAERESAQGVVFNMIRATIAPTESVSRTASANVGRDYSYRELNALMELLVQQTATPSVRTVKVPPGGRLGLLLSVAELLHDGVETAKATSRAPARKNLPYVFYKKQYDLTRVSSEILKQESIGGVTHARLLKSAFEIRARGESWTESFSIVCGIDGPLAEVPVFMTYQPRWWLKLELLLDERQAF
jgi:hypothetical protein